ncbi:hypothetical protein WR25_09981 [Diploscapter pachys]|uniref:Uncharacterized protein n=1 Tax=Diploscapter pachys TaxID=2018661 RepID=A0A2A2KF63_9BILA|nr:hypothetical protein WR25_09981 [Diploscapter pachys]
MVPAVARDFMPRIRNAADQSRMAIGDPAKREEGRLHPAFGEQVEHRAGVRLHPARDRVPVGAVDRAFERADLKPFLDIDRQAVAERLRRHGPTRRASGWGRHHGRGAGRQRRQPLRSPPPRYGRPRPSRPTAAAMRSASLDAGAAGAACGSASVAAGASSVVVSSTSGSDVTSSDASATIGANAGASATGSTTIGSGSRGASATGSSHCGVRGTKRRIGVTSSMAGSSMVVSGSASTVPTAGSIATGSGVTAASVTGSGSGSGARCTTVGVKLAGRSASRSRTTWRTRRPSISSCPSSAAASITRAAS